MSEIPLKTDGYCINKFIDRVTSKLGDKAAKQLKETAVEVVQNCLNVYSKIFGSGDVGSTGTGIVSKPYKSKNKDEKIPYGATGLIYGKVQSGKTNTTIATLALAQANQFRCFIVLTSDNTWLGKQTADRFANQLKGGPVVYNWEQWRSDPKEFANQLLNYINTDGVVLVSTKNVRHLDNLLKVLKSAKARSVPTLIFDDEADNASPNTNEAKQAKQAKKGETQVKDSAIFERIGQIREEVANHIYLQITATPQSLLLQNLGHRCSPAFCAALPEPGESYMGGDLFFIENSKYCCTKVKSEELEQLKKQKGENPGNNWDIPHGLRLALCCFFLGSIYKMQSAQNEDDKFSFLAHIDHKQISHKNLQKIILDFVIKLDNALRGESSVKRIEALKWLKEAYDELSKTAKNLPPLDDLIRDLEHELRSAIQRVNIIDATNPDKEPKYHPGMNILIGGNRLGRGVTIEGLMVTYYGRDPKQKVMDTVHQHARMFGYRQELKEVTRLFLPQHILEDFSAIHEADEGMRQVIGDDPSNIKIKPVWVGRQLKPTRSNVLNPASIDAFTPGSAIFPRDPLWKTAEVSKYTKALDNRLAEFKEDDEYPYEVDIDFLIKILAEMPTRPCPGYNWEDERVQQALQAMKAEGIQEGILYVRRGKKAEGLDLSNKSSRPWQGSGFAQSQWISKPRTKYQDVPTLVVMYEKGEKEKGWDNQPLYLPTLILPKSKFVFMFNYSDEPEELEDDLDLEDEETN